jgi:hypothetical protein
MPKFRQKPSSRRQARPTASWLVLGTSEARLVVHGQRTTHLTLVKPSHHHKRFLAGARLAVKAYVGGVTECPRRGLRRAAHPARPGRLQPGPRARLRPPRPVPGSVGGLSTRRRGVPARVEADLLERFQRRHAHREVWVIRFAVDRAQAPRLLAARSDELYVENAAMALPFEFPALTPDEHELHIGRPARDREARRQAMLAATRAALSTEQRVTAARRAAASKGLDMRSEFRLYDRHVRLERAVEALRQLELIESRVFPQRRAA